MEEEARRRAYEGRRDRGRKRLRERGLEAALVVSPANLYYLTGFYTTPHERVTALWLPVDGAAILLCPALDEHSAREEGDVERVVTYRDEDDPWLALDRVVNGSRFQALGIEMPSLSYARWQAVRAVWEGMESPSDIAPDLAQLRAIKDEGEVERIRRAICIAEASLEETIVLVKPGVTERELVAELEYRMKRKGADRLAFDTLVLTGKRAAMPHGKPADTPVREGELLLFDFGVLAEGYCSDITRTFAVGEIPEVAHAIYETVRLAQEAALEAVLPGSPIGAVDRAARDRIQAAGYGDYFVHRVGHGVGIEPHEAPSMHQANQDPLQPGSVLTIEPGIYHREIGGVRIEDDVLVAPSGHQILSEFPRELQRIGA